MTWLDALLRDVRFGIRSLRRELGVTLLMVAIVALGIGASTTVFGICRALLLRPLPFRQPERLVWIANGTSENLSAQTVQVNNLLDLRASSRSWEGIAGFFAFYGPGDVRLTGGGEPERITAVPVTETFFPLLGVRPLAGRFFDSAESRWQAPRTVVLGHEFWARRFGGDRGVVGRAIVLNDEPVTVVGVLPPTFDFAGTFTPGRRADVFVPFPLSPETNRQGNTLALVGRLKDGVTLAAAQAEAASIGTSIGEERMEEGRRRNKLAPVLSPLRERVSGGLRPALSALAGAVAFLMLLVCVNLANLLLLRASGRRRETAVRAALGAPRYRLVQQALAESFALSGAGAALGIALALVGTYAVSRTQGTTIPLLSGVRVDGTVLAFTVVVAMATGVGFGLLPALHGVSIGAPAQLVDGARGSTEGRGGRLRRALVSLELALVCVLLTGAGVLAHSLQRVLRVQPGFATANLLAVRVDPRSSWPRERQAAYFDDVLREVRALPGVDAAGLTDALPLGDNFGWRRWEAVRPDVGRDGRVLPLVRMIDEGYLSTMRIALRSGRGFTRADDAEDVRAVMVNERLARLLWPGLDPVGRVLRSSGRDYRVIGVVGDVHYFGLDRETDPEMYMTVRAGDHQSVDLVVRGAVAPAALAAGVRAALHHVDPSLPATEFRTMDALVDRSVFARRATMLLVVGFAGFGLLVAALGIYAVISYAVAQRTQELGIRMALGATPARLLADVLGQTAALAGLGIALGLPLAWAGTRALRGLLFEVSASDPLTFAAVFALLGLVAALAGFPPARRATRVDPAVALRPR